jgi:Tubulin binding cofactor C
VTNISNLHPLWASDLYNQKALKTRDRERNLDLVLDPPEKAKYIAYSELSEWLDTNMSLNEVLYPSFSILSPVFTPGIGASPKFSQSNSPLASCDDQSNGSNSPLGHDTIVFPPCEIRPTRIISTISSLSKSKPTVINNCATTVIHVSVEDERTAARGPHHRPEDHFMCVSGEEGRMSKSRKSTTSLSSAMSVSDQDLDPGGENTDSFVESDGAMSEGVSMEVPHSEGPGTGGQGSDPYSARSKGKRPDLPGGRGAKSDPDTEEDGDSDSGADECASSRHEEGAENLDALKGYSARRRRRRREGAASLPHLSINTSQGGHMHFLSAYSCVSISNCSDCEIVIGAVSGAVVVHGCERIKLTVACRKLIVQNSLECDLHVAALSASVIAGDSRSLIFGML